jgi:cell wall-associated NlpC family hydrolase
MLLIRSSLRRPFSVGQRLVFLAGVGALLFGAARVGGAQEPEAKPFTAYSNSARTLRDSLVALARAQIGTPYKRGGETPGRGFDCSGLVQYVMEALSFELPRTARLQARSGVAVQRDTSQLLPGDLLTFAKTKKSAVSHVGIYVGDGRFVHASSVAGRVIESPVQRPVSPLIKSWRGARRLLVGEPDSVAVPAKER